MTTEPESELDPETQERLAFEQWRVRELTKLLNQGGFSEKTLEGLRESLADAEREIARIHAE